jgi:hypothetical protein
LNAWNGLKASVPPRCEARSGKAHIRLTHCVTGQVEARSFLSFWLLEGRVDSEPLPAWAKHRINGMKMQ